MLLFTTGFVYSRDVPEPRDIRIKLPKNQSELSPEKRDLLTDKANAFSELRKKHRQELKRLRTKQRKEIEALQKSINNGDVKR